MTATVDPRTDLVPTDPDDEDFYPAAEDSAAEFALLDVYDERPSSIGQARPDALATISAGEKVYRSEQDKIGYPRVSRDGKIVLHDPEGRAPGLKAALEATDYRVLTVAFPFSDLRLFWQERFARYSASRLELYGDEVELREIVLHGENQPPEHVVHLARLPDGSPNPQYDRLRKTAKVSTSIYFALAAWDGLQPRIVFPDGLALYRLRTTSRHSRRSLLGALQTASRFTGGQLAGLPFQLKLTTREVADPGGTKRNIPVWSLLFRPPQQIALTSATWGTLRDAALAEGRVLAAQPALAAPRPENWQVAEGEGDVLEEPSDADLAQMLEGDSPADAEHWRRVWFTVTDHTVFAQDVARHKFFERYTEGRCTGLADFLKTATNADADAMVRYAVEQLNAASAVGAPTDVQRARARRYTEIFGGEDQATTPTAHPASEPAAPAAASPAAPGLDYTPEPTPFDDMEPPAGPQDDADDFYPEEPAPEAQSQEAPEDADIRAHTVEWLKEVKRRISEAHVNGHRSGPANNAQQKIVADLLLQVVEGDVGEASRLLKVLTTGAPGGTGSAKKLTLAQVDVIQGMAARPEWGTCAQAALRYA